MKLVLVLVLVLAFAGCTPATLDCSDAAVLKIEGAYLYETGEACDGRSIVDCPEASEVALKYAEIRKRFMVGCGYSE